MIRSNSDIPVTVDGENYWVLLGPQQVRAVESVSDFGRNARTRREFLGMSQQGVASLLQMEFGIRWHQTVVAKIEAGERQVKLNEALALSSLYAMDLEDLLTGWDLEGNGRLVRDENYADGGREIEIEVSAPKIMPRPKPRAAKAGRSAKSSAVTGRFVKLNRADHGVDQETS